MLNFLLVFLYFYGSFNQFECEYVSILFNFIYFLVKGNKFFIIYFYYGSFVGKLIYFGVCIGIFGFLKIYNIVLYYSKLYCFVLC